MPLVMQALAQLLVCSIVLVRHCRWSPLTVVLVLLVLRLMIWVLVRCLIGDFLHRIRGYRDVRFQGMAFLFWCHVRARASGPRIL
jgi:uncharacterized membrane protein required for colicin V production